jgi:hypothetical protein
MFKIQTQFIPGNDQIWVEQLTSSDFGVSTGLINQGY